MSLKRSGLKSKRDRFLTSAQKFVFDLARTHKDSRARLIRQVRLCAFFFVSSCLGGSLEFKASEMPSYKALMRIPIDLITADGVGLEKGTYELELKVVDGGQVLTFSSGGHVRMVVKPIANDDRPELASASIPVVGTHYLRPSTDPVLSGEERRFSKTGRPQYEEETRSWRAALRVYRTSGKSVFFVFDVKGTNWQWNHVPFKLLQR
jgi:hypothetical protein